VCEEGCGVFFEVAPDLHVRDEWVGEGSEVRVEGE
jgi:hypothetical protein